MSAEEKLNPKQFGTPKPGPQMYDILPERKHKTKVRLDHSLGGAR